MGSNGFIPWLTQELNARNLSQSEFARRGGISSQLVSQVLSGENPGSKFFAATAQVFGMPETEVMRLAGKLKHLGPMLPQVEDLNQRLLENFDEDGRASALKALDAVLRALENARLVVRRGSPEVRL